MTVSATAIAQTYMHVENVGETATYLINDVQVMTFSATDLNVAINSGTAPYAMNDVVKIIFDDIASVNENVHAPTVAVYPNPSSGIFTLDVMNGSSDNVTIDVFNVVGSRISTDAYTSSGGLLSKTIDISGSADGIYIVRIGNGKNVITRKIVKR
ncbi:MAG: T9SS type A sorting domain-containing protein [Flavobacteriales bacterium]|nr:T9SS type A sorting domain-containing protein [Flavobacteriales bacterium]